MEDKKIISKEIREKAESIYQSLKESQTDKSMADLESLTEELQIHQIELEIQNEELIHARKELEATHEEYVFLFNNSPLSYVLLDENGMITKANQTFQDAIAVGVKNVISMPLTSFMTDDSEYVFNGRYRAFFKEPGRSQSVYKFLVKGEVKHFSLAAAAYEPAENRVRRKEILVSLTDVSSNVLYQQKLEESNKELEKFTYRVSHDLTNQARQLRSFCKLLQDAEGEEAQEFTGYIMSLSNEINNVVEGLLNLSRSSSYELHRAEINLDAIAEDVVRLLRREFEEDKDYDVSIEKGLVAVADSNLAKILMANLISNAWKFSRYAEKPAIEIGSEKKSDGTYYFVKDNGVGIEAKYLSSVFETFSRFHPPEKFEGSGVGMATVKRIIDRHGGRVWLESKPGAGTTVYFKLD